MQVYIDMKNVGCTYILMKKETYPNSTFLWYICTIRYLISTVAHLLVPNKAKLQSQNFVRMSKNWKLKHIWHLLFWKEGGNTWCYSSKQLYSFVKGCVMNLFLVPALLLRYLSTDKTNSDILSAVCLSAKRQWIADCV